jgi:exonuclease SbcD
MSRVALTSDWHLPGADHPRHDDFARSVRWVVEDSNERGCVALLFAGDLYPSARPTPSAQLAAMRPLGDANWAGIPGNHDGARDAAGGDTVEIVALATGGWHNSEPNLQRPGIDGCDFCVAWFPWPSAAWLAGHGSPGPDGLRNLVAASLQGLADGVAKHDIPAILVAHLPIIEATTGSERLMALTGDWGISVHDIPTAFAASFFGHVHRPQELRGAPSSVWYTGAIERVDWGEEDVEVGYLTYDLESGQIEHIPNPHARRFVTLDVTGGFTAPDPERLRGANVRVRYRMADAKLGDWAAAAAQKAGCADLKMIAVAEPTGLRDRAVGASRAKTLDDLLVAYGEQQNTELELVTEAKPIAAQLAAEGALS